MIGPLLKSVFVEWWEDNAPRLGAALAFYTLFSLSPLLIIAVAIAGLIFGREAAQGHVVAQIEGLVGHEGATAVQAMIESARKPASGILASLFGFFTLLVGATGGFYERACQAQTSTLAAGQGILSWTACPFSVGSCLCPQVTDSFCLSAFRAAAVVPLGSPGYFQFQIPAAGTLT
jgi:Virulence factor BrkB